MAAGGAAEQVREAATAEQWRAAGVTTARRAATGQAAAGGRGGWLPYPTNHSVT